MQTKKTITKSQKIIIDALQEAIIMQQRGDLTRAENIYIKVLEKDPYNINALNLMGNIASTRKNYHQAIKILMSFFENAILSLIG